MKSDASSFEQRLAAAQVDDLYHRFRPSLERFLVAILRDPVAANDALQSTFLKLIEQGQKVDPSTYRGWLFRVAHNEAMLIKRKDISLARLADRAAWTLASRDQQRQPRASDEKAIRNEEIDRLKLALAHLPPEQRDIVVARIYHGQKFKQIAENLGIPLGTALGRMQTALKTLRKVLDQNEP